MILSKAKPRHLTTSLKGEAGKKKVPELDDFIRSRDYSGALTVLDFYRNTEQESPKTVLWIAYCAFHLGQYDRALKCYQELLLDKTAASDLYLLVAACYYYLQLYKESSNAVEKGPDCALKRRIQLHLAHKLANDNQLVEIHHQLTDDLEDQLCLASVHFMRSNWQEAADTYKKLLLSNRENIAINVYIAMCYYKMDYYDVSLEILSVYLQSNPDSPVAINLKACNNARLYNGKAAESEYKVLQDKGHNLQEDELIKHNTVVFKNGENALQVLPPLVDLIPEARMNLVIFYLKNGETSDAYSLMQDVEPSSPTEFILKAIVSANFGQATNNREMLKNAQQYFQIVGSSPSECDTIPGRQCMSSCYYLLNSFEEVNVYLKSIKSYLYNLDEFNWNYGISLASMGEFQEAEDCLSLVQNEKFREDPCFLSWLCRCYVMNGKPHSAWELYSKMDSSQESFSLLQLIANECYKMGQFFYSAKAFNILERLDPDPEFWEGKRGACVGVFQQVIAGLESKESLREVVKMLRSTSNPQVEYMIRIIKKWGMENGIPNL